MTLVLAGCQSQSYTPPAKEQQVSAAALGNPGTLRVGVNAASAPLAGQTSSSAQIVGIDVDVAAYLADQMGLKVELVDVGNDPTSALSEGKVDMVLGVDASEDATGYWKSNPYIQTGVALFGTAAESAVPTTDSKPQIAAQASSKSSWRVTNLFGDSSLVVQDDLKSAFDAMDKGTARYVAADAVIGTYVAYTNSYDDKIVALLQDPGGYCAAVAQSNTELQSAVAAAVDKLVNGGMMGIIESKWFGSPLDLANMTIVKSAADEKKDGDKKKDKKSDDGDKKSDDGDKKSDDGDKKSGDGDKKSDDGDKKSDESSDDSSAENADNGGGEQSADEGGDAGEGGQAEGEAE